MQAMATFLTVITAVFHVQHLRPSSLPRARPEEARLQRAISTRDSGPRLALQAASRQAAAFAPTFFCQQVSAASADF